MEKPSWICTLLTQLSLCFALYIVLNLGEPQKSILTDPNGNTTPNDLYFISVTGGYRAIQQQNHLLKQMERVAKTYKAAFVVDISEFGEEDPLMQNATWLFSSLKVPWYTTRTSKGQAVDRLLEHVEIPHGKTLDIIGVNTRSLQDRLTVGSSNSRTDNHLNLTRMLGATNSDWCIVVGYDSLIDCGENKEQMEVNQVYKTLHHIFMEFGVDVYLSRQGCSNFTRLGSVAYIGNLGGIENEPSMASTKGRDTVDGILLHRVSSLEIVTYFVTPAGEVVYKTVVRQRGNAVM